jgi:titin
MGGGDGGSGNLIQTCYIGTDLTGTAAGVGNTGNGILIKGPNNTIGGTLADNRNVISGNGINGIDIDGERAQHNTVSGNYIGTDKSGMIALANKLHGVLLEAEAGYNTIGGANVCPATARNVISGNDSCGLAFSESSNNLVVGNYIGVDCTGATAVANGSDGIDIGGLSTNNTIGAVGSDQGNVISGNGLSGIRLDGSGVITTSIVGNIIGLDTTGSVAVGNGGEGVRLTDAGSNDIGGSDLGERNVISGNTSYGVFIEGSGATCNTVAGNKIGTDITGTTALGNRMGIRLEGCSFNWIGVAGQYGRNLISGNRDHGIFIKEGGHHTVVNNFIGTNVSGTAALPNYGSGIWIEDSEWNQIGTPGVSGAGNLISGNSTGGNRASGYGIHIQGTIRDGAATATNNQIQGNFIGVDESGRFAIPNGNSGIDLAIGSDNTMVGGDGEFDWNLISANGCTFQNQPLGYGVEVDSNNNTIENNIIGWDIFGDYVLPNAVGWAIDNGTNNTWVGNIHD